MHSFRSQVPGKVVKERTYKYVYLASWPPREFVIVKVLSVIEFLYSSGDRNDFSPTKASARLMEV